MWLELKEQIVYVEATSMRTRATKRIKKRDKTLLLPKKYYNGAPKPAAMDSCFGLVRPHQHGTASACARGSHMIDIKVMENGRIVGLGLI